MKKTYTRSPEQRTYDHAISVMPPCECVHSNALTCLAEREHTTRFNAMILFAKGGNSDGKCTCKCHYTSDNRQVSEIVWNRRHGRISA